MAIAISEFRSLFNIFMMEICSLSCVLQTRWPFCVNTFVSNGNAFPACSRDKLFRRTIYSIRQLTATNCRQFPTSFIWLFSFEMAATHIQVTIYTSESNGFDTPFFILLKEIFTICYFVFFSFTFRDRFSFHSKQLMSVSPHTNFTRQIFSSRNSFLFLFFFRLLPAPNTHTPLPVLHEHFTCVYSLR